jgi:hypothetical protein
MLLTDPALQYWSCVAAIIATLAVLMLWNRVQGPKPVRVLSRVGLLLAGYLSTAVAILVSVNIAYGGLIVSVSDLFANVNPPIGQFAHPGACMGDGLPRGVPVADLPPQCTSGAYRQTDSRSTESLSSVDSGMATASVDRSK